MVETLTTDEIISLVYNAYREVTDGDVIFLDEGYTAREVALKLWDETVENHVSGAVIAGMKLPETWAENVAWNVARALACTLSDFRWWGDKGGSE